jgi:hypothetical protein
MLGRRLVDVSTRSTSLLFREPDPASILGWDVVLGSG